MTDLPEGMHLRPVRDADAPRLVDLVTRCFLEYPGCVMDLHDEEAGLLTPEASFDRMWIVERGGELCAMIALGEHLDATPPRVELKKLYVDPRARRQGLARRLTELVESTGRALGATVVDLWSDTRFTNAHALYEAMGYARTGATRELHDRSETAEFHFEKVL